MMSGFTTKHRVFCCAAFWAFAPFPATADTNLPAFDPSSFPAFPAISAAENRYFPLVSGAHWRLIETSNQRKDGPPNRSELTVLRHGPTILGVNTVTILDRDFEGDRLTEETRDFFARDRHGNVWYFGEAVMNYIYDRSGNLVETNTDSAWLAGVEGAKPGYIMPANPKVGAAYFQEYSKARQALDKGTIYAVEQSIEINGRVFEDVIVVLETTPLDPDNREFKYYAPGIGLIRIEEDLDADLKNPETVFELET